MNDLLMIRLIHVHISQGILLRLWSTLGLFSELSPVDRDYLEDPNKYLSTSLALSFGSQFVATLLKTESGYKLLTLVQGHPVKIAGCSSNPCPVEEFLGTYSKLVDDCILRDICPAFSEKSEQCSPPI